MTEQKNTIYDELNRKRLTKHFSSNGVLNYSNEYFYDGDNKTPDAAVQTHFYPDGKAGRITQSVYSQSKGEFVTLKDTWYNEDGQVMFENSFDSKTGLMNKKKVFKKNKDGFIFVHRTTFKDDGKTIDTDGIFVSLVGNLYPVQDKMVQKIIKNTENPFAEEKTNATTEPQKTTILSYITNTMRRR